MTAYRNSTKGARAIHLTNGGYMLVEAGATAEVAEGRVKRLAPGLVKAKNTVPPVPKDLARKVKGKTAKKPGNPELTKARADYKAAIGKQPSPRWDVATIREKIAAVKP